MTSYVIRYQIDNHIIPFNSPILTHPLPLKCIPQSSWPPIHRDVAVGHPLCESPRLIFPPWPLDLRRFLMGVEGGTNRPVGWCAETRTVNNGGYIYLVNSWLGWIFYVSSISTRNLAMFFSLFSRRFPYFHLESWPEKYVAHGFKRVF